MTTRTLRDVERDSDNLPARHQLTIDATNGACVVIERPGAAETRTALADSTKVFGPYTADRMFRVECRRGQVTWNTAPAEFPAADGTEFTRMKKLTQAAYDALDPPDATTLYVIVG